MQRGFFGNLIFAIIARMLCGNHLKTFWVIQWVLSYPKDSAVCTIWTTGPDGRMNWIGPFQAKRHLEEENISQFWLITAPYVTVFNYIYILTLICDNTTRLD